MYIYIQTTGYGPASAQIQAYSDRMTGLGRTGSNRASPSGDIWKNAGTKRGWPYSTISGRVDITCILYIVYFLYIFTIYARIGLTFLSGLPAHSSRFGDTPEHRYLYTYTVSQKKTGHAYYVSKLPQKSNSINHIWHK